MSNINESSSTFHKTKCKGCGAQLKYMAGEQKVTCPYCGVVNGVEHTSPAQSQAKIPVSDKEQKLQEFKAMAEEVKSIRNKTSEASRIVKRIVLIVFILYVVINFGPALFNYAEIQYLQYKSNAANDSTAAPGDSTLVGNEDQPIGDNFDDDLSGLTGNVVDPQQIRSCLQSVLIGIPDLHSYLFNDTINKLQMNGGNVGEAQGRLNADWIGYVMSAGCYSGDFGDYWRDEGRQNFLRAVSGIEPFTLKKVRNSDKEMNFINPEFVAWIRTRLILAPEAEVGGVSAQQIYDNVFRKQIRTLAQASRILDDSKEIPVDNYFDQVVMGDKWVIDYLREKHAMSAENTDHRGLDEYQFPLFAGFWIRRRLDGSYDEVLELVREVVATYDRQWGCDSSFYVDLCPRGGA